MGGNQFGANLNVIFNKRKMGGNMVSNMED